jgi:hypothetical protein
MSIQGKVNELQSIKLELKSLQARSSKLRKRMKQIEEDINDYLVSKDQPGLKYQGTAIIRETKEKRRVKKKNEQRSDVIYVLEKYGVHSPEKVFDEIMEAKRGSPTEHTKLKFKKYKNNEY